jgi:hypothetical protein
MGVGAGLHGPLEGRWVCRWRGVDGSEKPLQSAISVFGDGWLLHEGTGRFVASANEQMAVPFI